MVARVMVDALALLKTRALLISPSGRINHPFGSTLSHLTVRRIRGRASPNVRVPIRPSVVQVEREHASIGAVVPVAAGDGEERKFMLMVNPLIMLLLC